MSPPARRTQPERGGGTVLVLGASGVVTAVLVAALVLASVVQSTHRARNAADRAALAAAVPLVWSSTPDCAAAVRLAAADGASARACEPSAGGVEVAVAVPLPARWPGLPDAVTAWARAAP